VTYIHVHAGDVIATVKAHDLDSEDNAHIRYQLVNRSQRAGVGAGQKKSLQSATTRLFHLDTHTGQLSLRKSAALNELQSSAEDVSVYRLYLTARDYGTPLRSSTASLKVVVGRGAAQEVMTSPHVGVSVAVTSAVCVGCFLLAAFLLFVVVMRRRRRHSNHQHHLRHHHHERLTSSMTSSLQHAAETAHILPTAPAEKSSRSRRPFRDLEPTHDPELDLTTSRRLQVAYTQVLDDSLFLCLTARISARIKRIESVADSNGGTGRMHLIKHMKILQKDALFCIKF